MSEKDLIQAENTSAEQQTEAVILQTKIDKTEITDQQTLESAVTLLKVVKAKASMIEDERKKLKAPILEAGKAVDALFKPPLKTCSMAENVLKMKINVYMSEQERKREKAEALAREAADNERRRLEKLAANAKKRGDEGKAKAFQAREEAVAIPEVAPAEKVSGISQTETWKAELSSFSTLVKAAAEGDLAASDCLSFNQSEANRMARVLRGGMNIPGIIAVKETGIAASRRG